jgi:hypothetical protein
MLAVKVLELCKEAELEAQILFKNPNVHYSAIAAFF